MEDVSGWSADFHARLAYLVRQAWAAQKIRVGVNNQLKRLERETFAADMVAAVEPLLTGLESIEDRYKKQVEQYMRFYPLAPWIEKQRGIGLLLVAYILASTGQLHGPCGSKCKDGKHRGHFPKAAGLYKFLGMDVVKLRGHAYGSAPRKIKDQKASWSHRGRMTCFQIGDAIVKAGRGTWHKVYSDRRAATEARPRLGPSGCPFSAEPHVADKKKRDQDTGWKRKTGEQHVVQCVKAHVHRKKCADDCVESHKHGKGCKPDCAKRWDSAHVYADAKRIAVKAFLKAFHGELWRQWRAIQVLTTIRHVPAVSPEP